MHSKLIFFSSITISLFLKNVYAEIPLSYCKEIDNIAIQSQKQIDIVTSNLSSGAITQQQAFSQLDNLSKKTDNSINKINNKYKSYIHNDRPPSYECDIQGYKFKAVYYRNQVGYYKCKKLYSGSNFDSCASKVWKDNQNINN